ncbi:YaaA family protein [Lacisediminihabitans changchengi]|uniref:Peroxide stress protein YaaA n=1 Tax=Lacisediminihabitans changchengi TaxID=2787634 RepID=A0A934SLF1_9MICO|nr:peroxide stress protein YaaA [Lacisediminihabitans changchengi]MBK4347501.1 peroxide stress protein YaaA [Lacisediminihabitans changchengi]
MLVLLPPSETKRDSPLQAVLGSDDSALDLSALGFPGLASPRRTALAALRKLGGNRATMAAALRLGPSQQFEIDRNRAVRTSATMPALERYTGVLYDALEVQSLDAAARAFADDHLVIQSALFGLLRGSDPVPAYRLSHDSKLPELSLKKLWRDRVSAALGDHDGLVLDLRSEAYVELGPAPEGSLFLRVVAEGADGRRRALNHFNKKGKGEFARALVQAGIEHPDAESLLVWAAGAGIRLSRGAPGELELVVPEVVASRRSA